MKNLHPAARLLIVAGILVAALNLVLTTVDRTAGGARGGSPSSSYTTAPDGLAAFEELLRRQGRSTSRIREPLTELSIAPGATVFVMDGELPREETDGLMRSVAAGTRVVISGPVWADQLRSIGWSPEPVGTARVLTPSPLIGTAATVTASGDGSWTSGGPALPVMGGAAGDLLLVRKHGAGDIALLSTSSPLLNDHLDEADNAALGLALAGPERPVHFVETIHGYGDGRGLGALPWRVRWLGGFAALALCVWLAVRGRRLGPPELADRALAPARVQYVDALAASLRRSGRRAAAVMPVQAAAKKRLLARAGAPPDSDNTTLRGLGPRFGLSADEVEAILAPARTDDDVLRAGRALAKLRGPN